jgi:prepilin-type N-terminal cleavage/methylation domain-containing protein
MKKGFTLAELLAVIVILGILVVIIIPPVMQSVDQAATASYENLIATVEKMTQLYIREHKDEITGINIVGNTVTLTLQDLVNDGALKTPIMDSRNNKEIALDTPISIVVKPKSKYTVTLGTIHYVGE